MIKLGQAHATSLIEAPLGSLNLGDWMFTLTSDEYAACATGHQSAAQGRLPSGKRVSINVEFVAGYFMVQHYLETVTQRDHVLVVSPNTLMWVNDDVFVQAQITWELRARRNNDDSCELTCTVTVETDNATYAARAEEATRGVPQEQTPFQQHIEEETPLFAKDIQRKALAGAWRASEGSPTAVG